MESDVAEQMSQPDFLDERVVESIEEGVRESRIGDEEKEKILDLVEQPLFIKDEMVRKIPSEPEAKFFANLRLLAESLRNCEFIEDKEFKRKHLHLCIVAYQNLADLVISESLKKN